MKKINRIKANEEFAFTIKQGRSYKNSSYVVCIVKNNFQFCRIGISVPTKLGHAVVRTKTRRQIRAMCDSIVDYSSHTFDIVIIVKKGYFDVDYNKNLELLNSLLSNQIG